MQYDLERDTGPNGEPSLAEMTDKAIRILSHNTRGYFLMVEGRLAHFFLKLSAFFVQFLSSNRPDNFKYFIITLIKWP